MAIEENQMKSLLQMLKPDARIILVRDKEELLDYIEYWNIKGEKPHGFSLSRTAFLALRRRSSSRAA